MFAIKISSAICIFPVLTALSALSVKKTKQL